MNGNLNVINVWFRSNGLVKVVRGLFVSDEGLDGAVC